MVRFYLSDAALFACLLVVYCCIRIIMIKLRIAMFQLSGDENLVGCNLIIRRLALFVLHFMLFSLLVVE